MMDMDTDNDWGSSFTRADERIRQLESEMDMDDTGIEGEGEETVIGQLARLWMNERHAPTLLPSNQTLLSSVLDHSHRQTETIRLLRSDPQTSQDEHLRMTLVQMEIERVKFIVNSYTRTRLFKIEKYARHILIPDSPLQSHLTQAEMKHATSYTSLFQRHLHLTVLQSLPETQAHLDDEPIFTPPMITGPDLQKGVFVRARRGGIRGVTLPDGSELRMRRGHISLVPFEVVQELIETGDVELV